MKTQENKNTEIKALNNSELATISGGMAGVNPYPKPLPFPIGGPIRLPIIGPVYILE